MTAVGNRLRAIGPTRALALAAGLVLAMGIAGTVSGIRPTQSAWTDHAHVSAVAAAGTWATPATTGCVAMNANGTPKTGGSCHVTSIVVSAQWGANGERMRNYDVTFASNAQEGYIQFTVDLSAAGPGGFSWATAGLTAGSSHVTPTNGWTCAQLPILTGKTPTNWGWGAASSIFFQIAEDRASQAVKCS